MELKDELAAVKDELASTKNEQLATKDKLVATTEELAGVTNLTMTTKEELKMLEKEVTILRDPPHLHMCGSHYDKLQNYNSKPITFSTLLYSATNTEGGGLDISSGVFTAPWGGSYTVTWSTSSDTHSGTYNDIYLYKNSNQVEESRHYSHNGNSYVQEQGNNYYKY